MSKSISDKKSTSIVIIISVLVFLGGCAYFVGGVSATIAPIKIYDYEGSVAQFGSALKSFTVSNPDVTIKISQRGYSVVDDGFRDISIKLKTETQNIEHALRCENLNSKGEKNKAELQLVQAYDSVHITGGYSRKAVGVKQLVDVFEKDFLVRLKNRQGIILEIDDSFWNNFSLYGDIFSASL